MFSHKREHIRSKHLFTSQHMGHNTKSVFCHPLSCPGHVLNAFAFMAQLGAQHSSSLWTYDGQTGLHAFYVAPEKVGYLHCFCVWCSKIWVTTDIIYCPMVHHGQVAFLDLEKFYPILPSKLLSLTHCSCLLIKTVTAVIVTISCF